jgi:hypothetical protein
MAYQKILLITALSIFSLAVFSQQKDTLEDKWKHIDSLLQKEGLPQSALKEVDIIYNAAKKNNNDVHLVKALIYKMAISDRPSDEGKYDNIKLIEQEITQAKEPARSILHSIAGGSYWRYLQMNRWQFYNRTRINNIKSDDIATMDISELYKKISDHYVASLNNEELLKKTLLGKYDPILIKGNVRQLRPTLYDLLAFRAVDFFRNDERYITKPSYAFEISDSMAFADATAFAQYDFVTSDSLSMHHKALQIFQELIAFHLDDATKEALVDADLQRLEFVHNFGTHPQNDELYKQALEHIVAQHPDAQNIADAMYALAAWYKAKGDSYDPVQDTTWRNALVHAEAWCKKAIATKAETEGKQHAANLLKEITTQQITLETEKVNVPNKPFRMLVSYQNVSNAHIRIVRVNQELRRALSRDTWNDSLWQALLNIKPLNTFSTALPDTRDHQAHRTEIKVDALPIGEYAIVAATDKDFSVKEGSLAASFVYVSNIAYISQGDKYYVLNRVTGAPLNNASIQLWKERYDYRTESYNLQSAAKYPSDKNGFLRVRKSKVAERNFNYRLDISYKKDRLFLDDNRNSYVFEQAFKEPSRVESFLFTDRSIYRPGQTIYFKGIVINRDVQDNKNSILPSRQSVVKLFNANDEVVDSLVLTTNEFGSYNGKFILPSNLLNGEFSIRDNQSQAGFHVEEYKRPKFYVEINKPSETYRLNDSIHLEGTAKSYAGNNVNGATVSYTVMRTAVIPLWVRYGAMTRIWPPYPQQQMEIAHGEAVTDAEGKFVVSFKAIPDSHIPAANHPIFHYEVSADVTDLAGETRTGNTSIAVAYESLKLQLDVPELVQADSLQQVKVAARNLNDSFQTAEVTLNIYRLQMPDKTFRKRYWEQPDQFVMSREDYYRYFPFDEYADETDMTKWNRSATVFTTSATTKDETVITLPKQELSAGWYLFEIAATDKDGKAVTDKKYVQVYKNKIVSATPVAMLTASKKTAEPGDELTYALLTNFDNIHLVHELSRTNDTITELINAPLQKNVDISTSDRGGVTISVAFVKNNRVYANDYRIDVPFLDKMLKIDYATFRDKTLPGTKETWKVTISGMKGEKAAAELLTAMYDASLDQFYPHSWRQPGIWNNMNYSGNWRGDENFTSVAAIEKYVPRTWEDRFVKIYDRLKVPYENLSSPGGGVIRGRVSANFYLNEAVTVDSAIPPPPSAAKEQSLNYKSENQSTTTQNQTPPPSVQPRKNLNETAFFFPTLYTDSSGNVEFSFTTPEALTTWKWMLLAHTKELAFGYDTKTMITQKELMVQPNMPRFLREGDKIELSARIVNISTGTLNGNATLVLTDPTTNATVNDIFRNITPSQSFTAKAGETVPVKFSIAVPNHFTKPVTWKIVATANGNNQSFSDGEESLLPVITNRMLVTESLPLPIRNTNEKQFTFTKLLNSSNSKTLQHQGITVEFTSNPAWYAVQALPYLAEEKDENAERLFNRYYANALGAHLANSSPRLKAIIEQWKDADTSAFLSNLQKNEELKSILLQETPWVLEAKTEAQQKKNIALLFDMVRMSSELNSALTKLKEMQAPTGGFVWLKGAPEDRFMTQYILSGIGHLKKLDAIPAGSEATLDEITGIALNYLDEQVKKDYDRMFPDNKKVPVGDVIYMPIHYLYMRSFFTDIAIPDDVKKAYNYFRDLSKKEWIKQNNYLIGMTALSLFRTGDAATAKKIMASLKETAIRNEEMGMYWKGMKAGYYWYQAPIETQSLMIEAFSEINNDITAVADLKTWLLKNKQTNNWKTSKATADACYALLLQGGNWIQEQPTVQITLGKKEIEPATTQAGTGYFKTFIPAGEVSPSMGKITVSMKDQATTGRPAWGAVYWQYFEELDNITQASGPLSISKKLFVQKNSDRGPVLEALDDNNTLHVGDRVKVRIEIRSDRDLEYVHLKDMRASAFEPVNVLSSFKWKGGLGYYESTKDVSTSFFFSYLPKGVHIFEYDLFVTHTGTFSNGVSTIQCLYAPEFSSHTEGIKVNVVNK